MYRKDLVGVKPFVIYDFNMDGTVRYMCVSLKRDFSKTETGSDEIKLLGVGKTPQEAVMRARELFSCVADHSAEGIVDKSILSVKDNFDEEVQVLYAPLIYANSIVIKMQNDEIYCDGYTDASVASPKKAHENFGKLGTYGENSNACFLVSGVTPGVFWTAFLPDGRISVLVPLIQEDSKYQNKIIAIVNTIDDVEKAIFNFWHNHRDRAQVQEDVRGRKQGLREEGLLLENFAIDNVFYSHNVFHDFRDEKDDTKKGVEMAKAFISAMTTGARSNLITSEAQKLLQQAKDRAKVGENVNTDDRYFVIKFENVYEGDNGEVTIDIYPDKKTLVEQSNVDFREGNFLSLNSFVGDKAKNSWHYSGENKETALVLQGRWITPKRKIIVDI